MHKPQIVNSAHTLDGYAGGATSGTDDKIITIDSDRLKMKSHP